MENNEIHISEECAEELLKSPLADYVLIMNVYEEDGKYDPLYDIDEAPIFGEPWFPDPRNRADRLFEFMAKASGCQDTSSILFSDSLKEPLCRGGDLNPKRLLLAYTFGIFPWFSFRREAPLWWAPLSRYVLFPDEIHISHSMRTLINKNRYRVTVNEAFPEVIESCRTVNNRSRQRGAWLSKDIVSAYTELWRQGYVKSVEVWDNESGNLVGGLYGVWLNRCFMGESMFSYVPSGSKIALIGLCEWMRANGGKVIDLQIKSDHLESMGGRYIEYLDFLRMLNPKAAEAAENDLLDISFRNGNPIPEPTH